MLQVYATLRLTKAYLLVRTNFLNADVEDILLRHYVTCDILMLSETNGISTMSAFTAAFVVRRLDY